MLRTFSSELIYSLFFFHLTVRLSEAVETCVDIPGLPTEVQVPEDTPINSTIFSQDVFVVPFFELSFEPSSGSDYIYYYIVDGFEMKIELKIKAALDYETLNNFAVIFNISQDQTETSCYIDVIVIDKPEAPAFTEDVYYIHVNEGVFGTNLTTVDTGIFDPDEGDIITFSITSPQSGESPFAIDSQSGLLSYANDYSIDKNANPDVIVAKLVATDTTGLSDEAIVIATVSNINDNVPRFSVPDVTVYVSPLTPLGATIQIMIATDADGDNIDYTLNGTEIIQTSFKVDDGHVKLIKELDTHESMVLNIIASDGQFGSTATVTVSIQALGSNNNSAAFTSNEASNDNSCSTSNASLSWAIPLVLVACTAAVIASIAISRKFKKGKEGDGSKVIPIAEDVVPAVA